VTQSYFLQGCGILSRVHQYITETLKTDEEKEKFGKAFEKVMDIDQLGGHFKVLGFAKKDMGVPLGFREATGESGMWDSDTNKCGTRTRINFSSPKPREYCFLL